MVLTEAAAICLAEVVPEYLAVVEDTAAVADIAAEAEAEAECLAEAEDKKLPDCKTNQY